MTAVRRVAVTDVAHFQDTMGRRGHTRRRRTGLATAAGAVLGCLLIAGTASASYWDPAILLRSGPGLQMEDLAAGGTSVAVGWSESSAPRELWAKTSDASGSAFGPRFRLAVDPSKSGRALALDVGGGSVWASWAEDRRDGMHPHRWRVMIGMRDIGGGAFSAGEAVANQRGARNVDLGFGGGRVWIGFQEPSASPSTSQIRVWSSLTASVGVGDTLNTIGDAPLDEGTAQLAAVPTRGYVAWANGGIRFKSANVGAGPSYAVTWNATRLLSATGTAPIMDAGGNLVIVAWTNAGDLWFRISGDRGATWGAVRRLADGSFPDDIWVPHDLDIAGSRVVLVVGEAVPDRSATQRFQSTTSGSTWTGPVGVGVFTWRYDDFVSVGGVNKVVEAWADEFTPEPQPLYFRRQH